MTEAKACSMCGKPATGFQPGECYYPIPTPWCDETIEEYDDYRCDGCRECDDEEWEPLS